MDNFITRREFLKAVALTSASALIAACAPSSPQSAAQPTAVPTIDKASLTGNFTVAAHNPLESRQNVGNTFFAANYPKMTVKYDVTPGLDNYFLKMQAQIAGGTPPDYMLMHETRAAAYSAQGLLLSLEDYQKSNPMPGKASDYAGVDPLKYKGVSYVWPSSFANYAILYNKDLFDKAGVAYPQDSWTWADLAATAKKFSSMPDVFGFAGAEDPSVLHVWYPLLKAHGGEMFDEADTQCLLNTPEAIQTMDFMRDLWTSKAEMTPAVGKQLSGGYAVFLQGKVAMLYFYTGFFNDMHTNRKGGFKYGVVALPAGPKGRFIRTGGSQYAIPKGSKFPQVAWELMRYTIGDPEGARIGFEKDNSGASRLDYFEKYFTPPPESLAMVPNWKMVAIDQAVKYGVFVRYSKIGTTFAPMVGAEMNALADGSKSAADVAKSITDKANQMIKDFK
jgi:multiple sugar transport system substrate-binding protein